MRRLKNLYLGLMLIFLYSPIVVLIVFSFNNSRSRANWDGFTLRWYAELFGDATIMNALMTTLSVAVISALVATIIGTAAAVGLRYIKGISRNIFMNFTNIPVVAPEIVIGLSLMILFIYIFNRLGTGLGYHTLLLAHIIFNVPFVILSVLPKLRQMDESVIEAALDLGATPLYTFFHITLPYIRPGVITGMMLAFTLSIDDFVISFFTAGSGTTNLSILIFSMARRGVNPKINALSAIMFSVVLLLLYLINRRETNNAKGAGKDCSVLLPEAEHGCGATGP